jgi:hypothetical protein
MSSAARFVAVASLVGLFVAARRAPVSTASLTFFTDRAAFQARASQMALEAFANGNVPAGGVMGCPGPLDMTSNNACFSPGGIQPGVQFNSDPTHDACATGCEIALVGQGALSAPSKNIAANFGGDAFVMSFAGGNVTAVGADLIAYFTTISTTCSIEIWGASGVLGTTTAPCTPPNYANSGVFWGVIADQAITKIRIVPPPGSSGLAPHSGVLDVSFGAGAPTVKQVAIDVKPGSDNTVNPRSQGVTPVAILGAADFDASQVDVGSVAFGPGGAPQVHSELQDVNGDGLPDLVLHFSTPAAQIACGDTQVSLTGRTLSGGQFKGTGAVRTVGCAKS